MHMMSTQRRASELAGEYKPQIKEEMDEEELMWPSQGTGSETRQENEDIAAPSLDTKKEMFSHKQRKARVCKARFILAKIAKNEAKGKADPRDVEDKARFLAQIAEFEAYKKANPEAKRHQSQDVGESAPKRAKDSQGKARARDTLAMALVDELHEDGRLLSEKWDEIEAKMADMVTDRLVAMPTGPIPSFDSSDVVRGHRVIRCDDEFSRSFLAECMAKISGTWTGLKIKLAHAKDIPRRPRARIWLPKGQTDHERVIQCLRAQNPNVYTADWAILKAEKELQSSQPFLLLINQRCLPQLKAQNHEIRYGIRKAKMKVFLAEPDEILEEVDGTNKLLDDVVIDYKSPT
ncbi:hypothetical protein KR054_006722 [Drosophila jambulina]|nr:hypothetical protein KR054_006722 [Drosophila jambulina]